MATSASRLPQQALAAKPVRCTIRAQNSDPPVAARAPCACCKAFARPGRPPQRHKAGLVQRSHSRVAQAEACNAAGIGNSNKQRGNLANSKSQRIQIVFNAGEDQESDLQRVLQLASSSELQELCEILYGRSLMSPLLKSFAPGDGSSEESVFDSLREGAQSEGRNCLLQRLEARFLYLAADAKLTLSGRRPTYRDVLLRVKRRLKVHCSSTLPTSDLEAEIFLHLLQDYKSKVESTRAPPSAGEGKKYANKTEAVQVNWWPQNLLTTVRLGGKEMMTSMLKGGSALTMSAMQQLALRNLTGKLLLEQARYQIAKEACLKGGRVVACKLESRLAYLTARQGLAGAAGRYVALRYAMSFLGPLLWGTFLADVVLQAVGTDYARVVRAIFALAQIRLTRTYGWTKGSEGVEH
eukprot:SM000077S21577  [mRNA]  locus=s77:281747:285134:+ [translate_table: standard]